MMRNEKHASLLIYELSSKIDSLWWKIGILAGAVSIVIGKVFGTSAIGIFTGLI